MIKFLPLLLLLLTGCADEEPIKLSQNPYSSLYDYGCFTSCALNVESQPVCGTQCKDGYLYIWFPTERIEAPKPKVESGKAWSDE